MLLVLAWVASGRCLLLLALQGATQSASPDAFNNNSLHAGAQLAP